MLKRRKEDPTAEQKEMAWHDVTANMLYKCYMHL